MTIEIITIGDELLIGQVIDTNSAWMAQLLNQYGFIIKYRTAIGDDSKQIKEAIKVACNRVSIVLVTGGLGPTKDDITKKTLCEYFKTKLVLNKKVLHDIEKLFEERGRIISPVNRMQAEIPENCIALRNSNGTAPGMLFEQKGKIIISMPGVPYEMRGIMEEHVIPFLNKNFKTPSIVHHTVLTHGIGESAIAELISDWEDALPKSMKLAYLPASGMVRLRITAISNEKNIKTQVSKQIKNLKPLISKYIYGEGDTNLQELIANKLIENNATLAIAESCTGGLISHLITSVPGCSKFYCGSIISYDNSVKLSTLGVKKNTLEKHGAVSEQTVLEMAAGIQKKFKTSYAISTSGVAGPSGGTVEKPVGLVWIGIATPTKCFARKVQYGSDRMRNITVFAQSAMRMLLRELDT
ncbi:MAG: competence/damage-inducible protein A [Bacteroidetes bacterium]|nr:competence/damage-inducible protein A [Bacteroidota bacterium]